MSTDRYIPFALLGWLVFAAVICVGNNIVDHGSALGQWTVLSHKIFS